VDMVAKSEHEQPTGWDWLGRLSLSGDARRLEPPTKLTNSVRTSGCLIIAQMYSLLTMLA
jgi:hypothetical protein